MFREKSHGTNDFFIRGVTARLSGVHGVGCFATQDIKKHEVFEASPALIYTPAIFNVFREETEVRHIHESYVFFWDHGTLATAWGYASLYNHANGDGANAGYRLRKNADYPGIEIYATKNITAGEEIFLHYMHHKFDVEFDEAGEWWASHESDMSSAIGGYDDSMARLMSDHKKNYR